MNQDDQKAKLMKESKEKALEKFTAHRKAIKNLSNAIDTSLRFPKKVFLGDWSEFFFFDSDWIFEASFAEKTKALFQVEGAVCSCLVYFDAVLEGEHASFFFDTDVTGEAFQSFLGQPRSRSVGWLNCFGSFGCTSDVGQWCIYCERGAEIAVIAFQKNFSRQKHQPLITLFKAQPIDRVFDPPLSYCFEHMKSEWRRELEKNYGRRQL